MITSLYPVFRRWSDGCAVWLISDTHFMDKDCLCMDPRWPLPEDHIAMINSRVGKHDTIIHLGDVGHPSFIKRLNGDRKILITGNHDLGNARYVEFFDEIYNGPLVVGQKLILSHEPVDVPWAYNIHGHCHCRESPVEERGFNVTSDVVDFKPINLGNLIKDGALSGITNIHRMVIDDKYFTDKFAEGSE